MAYTDMAELGVHFYHVYSLQVASNATLISLGQVCQVTAQAKHIAML